MTKQAFAPSDTDGGDLDGDEGDGDGDDEDGDGMRIALVRLKLIRRPIATLITAISCMSGRPRRRPMC